MNKIAVCLVLCLVAISSRADVPLRINYQGRLLSGTNLVNGSVGLSLRLYDASAGGALLYEDSNTVTVSDGLYATSIGDNTTAGSLTAALTNAQVWVEVAVGGVALTPREQLVAVGYALTTRGLLVDANTNLVLLPEFNTVATSFYGHATIGGGEWNQILASSGDSVIGGGYLNVIRGSAAYSTIAGGGANVISNGADHSVIGGGAANSAGAPYATVPGGSQNVAGGASSFAAGTLARAMHSGTFVWADSQGGVFGSATSNQFLIRASGGVGIGTTNTTGVMLSVAGNVLVTGSVVAASLSGNGAGVTNIVGGSLAADAVSNVNLAANAVTSTKIADGSIVDGDVNVNAAILATKIANTALVQTTVFDGDLTGTYRNLKLYGGAVSNSILATDAVTSTKIADGAIINVDINVNAAILATKIANTALVQNTTFGGAVTGLFNSLDLAPGAVTGTKIADGTISNADLAAGAVTGDKIASGTITNANIAFGTIKADRIVDGSFVHITGDTMTGALTNQQSITASRFFNAGNAVAGTNSVALGGSNNSIFISSGYAVIGGGFGNMIMGLYADYSTIGGGLSNAIGQSSSGATVGGGVENDIGIGAFFSTIAGGNGNLIGGASYNGAIGGGLLNQFGTNANDCVIGGGFANNIRANVLFATIAGGATNVIGSADQGANVGGGEDNRIGSATPYGTVAGGFSHRIGTNAVYSVIGGGGTNAIGNNAAAAIVAGGYSNKIGNNSDYSSIGGGNGNILGVDSTASLIAGGQVNHLGSGALVSTIGGGEDNSIGDNSSYALVAGGQNNNIGGNAWYPTIAGGHNNTIGDQADGSFIAGGYYNGVSNTVTFGFAAGQRARVLHSGSFVWGDSFNGEVTSSTSNQVTFRCQGGVRFLNTNGTLYASWVPGAANWTIVSDAAMKEQIAPVDAKAVLEKVAALPISEWNYTGYPQRHIGPMAQDFHAAFPLNENDEAIDSGDLPGVALAAIQALKAENDGMRRENAELKAALEALAARVQSLEAR